MPALDPDQWAEVDRLFAAAMELPFERRLDFLSRACSDDDTRREAASLLEHASGELASVGEAIAAGTAALAGEPDPDERLVGSRLGPYRIVAIAGHGGMGAVYRASRDDAEFHQQVAIKLVRAAAESPDTLRRFKQERQILARLAHPNIARLLDGGSTTEGVPYLVMEFIEGEPVTAWCERQSLTVEQRLRLFLCVCEGVAFAHGERVVHRDLKPANILVTRSGVPKLLDFGIAKLLDGGAQSETLSMAGLQVMTPEYAAPEQVRGETVSAATDVYALGLVLYEMLTGEKAQEIPVYTPGAIARAVCHTEPKTPAALKPQLAGDLDNIIRMAIRKEPERRYGSVADLAGDIQRHLEGRTVTARPDTFGYRSAKFLGRHRITAGVSLLAPVGVAGGVGLALLLGGSARVPRVSQVVQITQTGRVEVADTIVTDGSRIYFTERAGGHWSLSQVSAQGGATQPLPLPPALSFPEILDISPDHSQLLMTCQLGTGDDRPLWVIPIQGGPPRRLGDLMGSAGAWSADGRSIVFSRGTALFQANAEGRDCRKIADTPGQPDCIRWSPLSGDDVIRFALLSLEGRARILWQIHADGSGMHPLLRDWRTGAGWPDSDDSGTWIAGGKYYLYRSRRGSVSSVWARREPQRWWGGFGGRPAQIYSTPQELAYLAPAPDGKRVFFGAGQERRELMRYDPVRGQFLPFLPGVSGRFVAFSKDGRWIAYTTFREGALWRSRTDGSERLRLTPEGLAVSRPQWSPDGSWIAVAAGPTARILMIPAAGGAAQNITTAAFQETSPAWSADGGSLLFLRFASAGADGRKGLYVMDWKTRHTRFLPGSESMSLPAWSPDPRYIAASSSGTQISICDLQSGRWTKLAEGAGLSGPTWSRDGKYVYYQDVLGGMEQPVFRVRIRDMKTERVFSLSQIPQSNLTGYGLAGLDPTEAPIVSLIRANADIYALELDLP